MQRGREHSRGSGRARTGRRSLAFVNCPTTFRAIRVPRTPLWFSPSTQYFPRAMATFKDENTFGTAMLLCWRAWGCFRRRCRAQQAGGGYGEKTVVELVRHARAPPFFLFLTVRVDCAACREAVCGGIAHSHQVPRPDSGRHSCALTRCASLARRGGPARRLPSVPRIFSLCLRGGGAGHLRARAQERHPRHRQEEVSVFALRF